MRDPILDDLNEQQAQAVAHGRGPLMVLAGALASVVSLGYYLRLVWAMFMKPPGEALDKTDVSVGAVVALTSLAMFPVLTIFIQMLLDAAARAAGG